MLLHDVKHMKNKTLNCQGGNRSKSKPCAKITRERTLGK
jgi:hypothetical protein